MTGRRNFQRMHRGWGPKPKRVHRTALGAWWHLRRHRARIKVDADVMWIYPCWFTDEDTLARRRHYHIGHMPGTRSRFGAPREGKLYLGLFAVDDGYETRVFRTGPPQCLPARPTIEDALAEYTSNKYHAV
jgi:hypothetical protein